MSRRNSRADLILKGARERVQQAQDAVNRIKAEMDIANATLRAHAEAFDQLQQDLAPTQRKVKDPKSTAPAAKKRSRPGLPTPGLAANTELNTGGTGSVVLPDNPDDFHKLCAVPGCGLRDSAVVHFSNHPSYHPFHAEIKTKKATA